MQNINKIENLLGLINKNGNMVISVELFMGGVAMIGLIKEKGIKKIVVGKTIQEAIQNSKLDVNYL